MTRRFTALAAACLVAVPLAACGDDEEDTAGGGDTTTTTAPTKQEFVRQADQICADVNRQLEPVPERKFSTEGGDIIEGGLDELRSLTPPEGQEQQVDAMISAGEAGLTELREAETEPARDPFARFTELSANYGLKGGCTRNQG